MRINQFIRGTVMVASFTLFAGLPALSTQAEELSLAAGGIPEIMGVQPSTDNHNAPASAGGLGEVAAGAVEDTLKACLARIPKVATTGQRMLAELGCEQEAGTRHSIQDAPRF